MNKRLDAFLHYLQVEKGLSDNTIDSYRRDLTRFLSYLKEQAVLTSTKLNVRIF